MTTSGLDRRTLLRRTAATGLGIAFAGSIDAIAGTAAHAATRSAAGYGPLVADPAGVLSLPKGFSYRVLAESGQSVMEGGALTPADMDGMAAFTNGDGLTLVYNHEISGSESPGVPVTPDLTYDPGARGGTTSIDLDARGGRVREYVSVAGTENNCAGGVTPWGTWLTCEETDRRAGSAGRLKDHGYVFEVSPVQSENPGQSPEPLRFLGRFAHEAVAVDPETSVVYETEDASNPNGLYFRWVPPAGFVGRKGALVELARSEGGATAGLFQAMVCTQDGQHVDDLSQATTPGTRYQVSWVDVPDRDGIALGVVRRQFGAGQVTRARKLEGAWWADGGAYFVSSFARTSDGSVNQHDGQVWFYDPRTESVTLKTLFGFTPEDSDSDVDGPDNITVSPYGGVILAEDGAGKQFLVGVTDQGKSYSLARNDGNGSEFTGPVFSPDGSTLFACIQSPGRVFAITGPWGRPSNAAV